MKNKHIRLALALLMLAHQCVQAQNTPNAGLAITLPAGSEYTQGEAITFAGVATQTGSQFPQSTPRYYYSWTSNIDGPLGTGVAITVNRLTPGSHTITLYATDENGGTLSAEKTVTIKPRPLAARISSSDPEGFFATDEKATLKAVADGGVPPYRYAWTIDNAAAGSEEEITRTFSSAAAHKIGLTIRDAAGSGASASIGLTVYAGTPETNSSLTAIILQPPTYASFRTGTPVKFSALASGGREPYGFLWTTDTGGLLSRQKEFVLENLSIETHKTTGIHLTVTDSSGVSASSAVIITLEENCAVDGTCSTDENYLNCPKDCAGKKDGYCDRLADGLCDPDCARADDPDCACDKNGLCESPYENPQNCPDDCPTGVSDGRCDKIKDARCDPDCGTGEDPDCGRGDGANYFMLFVLVLLVIAAAAYLRLMRRR